MDKWLVLLTITAITLFLSPGLVTAQTNIEGGDHTAREELEGKEIWEKLQAKQLECKDLTDNQYGALGEYFMGQSIGDTQRHAVMNQMMIAMMGEEGEEQMHITLGKRASGCDTNAEFPAGYGMPMMPPLASLALLGGWWMMGGGGNPMMNYGWGNMMGGWSGFGLFNWIFMVIFWILVILGVVALVRYLATTGSSKENKTPLEILKARYAKGEINKKEFEEKKKDLA